MFCFIQSKKLDAVTKYSYGWSHEKTELLCPCIQMLQICYVPFWQTVVLCCCQLLQVSISTNHRREKPAINQKIICINMLLYFVWTLPEYNACTIIVLLFLQKRLPRYTRLRSFIILKKKRLIQQAAQLKAWSLIIQMPLITDAPLSTELTHWLLPFWAEFEVINPRSSIKEVFFLEWLGVFFLLIAQRHKKNC